MTNRNDLYKQGFEELKAFGTLLDNPETLVKLRDNIAFLSDERNSSSFYGEENIKILGRNIDLMMNIRNIRTSRMAEILRIDSAHISRIRQGAAVTSPMTYSIISLELGISLRALFRKDFTQIMQDGITALVKKLEGEKELDERTDVRWEDVKDLSIEELELSVRSYRCLVRANIYTVGDLIARFKDDPRGFKRGLMDIINVGPRACEEIIDTLRHRNIPLHGEGTE